MAYRTLIVLDDADSREGLALLLGLDHSVEMAEQVALLAVLPRRTTMTRRAARAFRAG